MNKILLFFATLLCCIVLTNAQENYVVSSNSDLNVRSSASTSGTTIDSESNEYLTKVQSDSLEASPVQVAYEEKYFWENVDLDQYATHNVGWMIYVIFGLSVVLWIIRKKIRYRGYVLTDVKYWVNLVLFIITCILECVYMVLMGSDRLWFCMPDDIGWIGAIFGFIGLGWVVYNQFICFIDTMTDIRYNAGGFDMRLGLYSWPVAIIAALVAGFAGWDDANVWIVVILAGCQIVQIGMIIAGVAPCGGGAYSVLAVFVYLIGVISTLILLLQFIILLIVVVVIGFCIMAFAKGSLSSSGSSSSSSSSDNRGRLYSSDGMGSVGGFYSDDNTFHEDGGGTYDKQADGTWKKR